MDRKIVIPLQSLLETYDGPAVLIDRDYRIVAANRAYCESYEVAPDKVVGKTCHEVSHHSPVPCHEHGEACPHREVFLSNQGGEVLHTHYDFENRPDYVRIRARPLGDAAGEVFMLESLQRLAPRLADDTEIRLLIGKSPVFVRFLAELSKAAQTTLSIWLHGENGTGKMQAARFIHARSVRGDAPFVAFDCAAHHESLIESELFGSRYGDARLPRPGALELAGAGTLFMDQFDALPLAVQGKLLRVFDGSAWPPDGEASPRARGPRMIVASRCDLAERVSQGLFRQDLYYRVAGFRIRAPALRERREDIPLLAEALLGQIALQTGQRCQMARDALDTLVQLELPGNLHELHGLLLGAAVHCTNGVIEAGDIDVQLAATGMHDTPKAPDERRAMGDGTTRSHAVSSPERDEIADPAREQEEAETIRALLKRYGSRRTVAKKLGISVPVLYRKLKQLGIINIALAAISMVFLFD